MQDISNLAYRKMILDEIFSNENKQRKAESFKRSEVMKNRHQPYVIRALKDEFSDATVADMRKVTSINVAPQLISEQAKTYLNYPKREFVVDGASLEGERAEQTMAFYDLPDVDSKMLKFHRILKYQKQAFLQVVPARGMLDVRLYQPHQLDVIPMDDSPEDAFAFVISSYDRSQSLKTGDGVNQKIADRNDGQTQDEKAKMRFVWWSAEHNLISDGNGDIIGDPIDISNPIGRLPFVEGADGKENEFWVREGAPEIDFALDLAVVLSDTSNTNRLQAYAQAVMASFEKPTELKVGPTSVIHLQLEREASVQPSFQFVSPSSNIEGSISFIDTLVNFFLTAKGIDPKVVNSSGQSQSFSSGFERLLATLKDFENSREDLSLLDKVERELFELFLAWHEVYKGTTGSPLDERYNLISLPKETKLLVDFHKPELVQTKKESQESVAYLEEKGYRSKVMALMEIDELTEEQAIEKLEKIREHQAMFAEATTQQFQQTIANEIAQDKKQLPEGQGTEEVQEAMNV